jgi:hypothetical protein
MRKKWNRVLVRGKVVAVNRPYTAKEQWKHVETLLACVALLRKKYP